MNRTNLTAWMPLLHGHDWLLALIPAAVYLCAVWTSVAFRHDGLDVGRRDGPMITSKHRWLVLTVAVAVGLLPVVFVAFFAPRGEAAHYWDKK